VRRSLGFVLASLLLASESAAAAPPLDRIVAVVDRGIITLSEVRARARIRGAAQAEVLQQIIDERLIALEAAPYIVVADDEIDRGIAELAKSNQITVEQLYAEVERVGMTRDGYREEVRRQLLDGKWTMLVVRAKLQVDRTDEKAFMKALDAARAKELERLRAKHYIEVRK
jgi:peptidyl-prolyl cis-trans isomerase SurA